MNIKKNYLILLFFFICSPLKANIDQKFTLKSSVIKNNSPIPIKYTGDGKNISPDLSWSNIPRGSKEYVLICNDPDAPSKTPWVHWIIYNIDKNILYLKEGEGGSSPKIKFSTGKNSWGKTKYMGPLPPKKHGWHRYFFTIYALNKKLNLKSGLTASQVIKKIKPFIIGKAQLIGKYKRN